MMDQEIQKTTQDTSDRLDMSSKFTIGEDKTTCIVEQYTLTSLKCIIHNTYSFCRRESLTSRSTNNMGNSDAINSNFTRYEVYHNE